MLKELTYLPFQTTALFQNKKATPTFDQVGGLYFLGKARHNLSNHIITFFMTDKAISSFVAMLRFNRKYLNVKGGLEIEVLSISYYIRNNHLSIDDEWKLGYYLPKESFLKLEKWVTLRMFKI